MRTLGLLILTTTLSLSAAACGQERPPGASAQSPQPQANPSGTTPNAASGSAQLGHRELVARGAPLIDVRTPQEFQAGHVEGAVNIPVDQVGARLDEIKGLVAGKDNTLVVYCRSGNRSAHAARALRAAGYEVVDFGPMSAW